MTKKTKKAAKKADSNPEIQVIDAKEFVSAPRKRRESKTDALAAKLIELPNGKMVLLPVPEGSDATQYRSYAYTAMQRSLKHLKPKADIPVSIRISEDAKNLAIALR